MNNEELKSMYKNVTTIAVVGSSPKEDRPVYKVSSELKKRNYKIVPINPNYDEILGEKVYKDLEEIPFEVDVAVFFVNSERALEGIKKAIKKNIKYIWLQEGVMSKEGEQLAKESNIFFMMDKCIYKELKKIESEN